MSSSKWYTERKKNSFAFFRLLIRWISYDIFKRKSIRIAINNQFRFRTHTIVIDELKRERLNFFLCSFRTQENVEIERVNVNIYYVRFVIYMIVIIECICIYLFCNTIAYSHWWKKAEKTSKKLESERNKMMSLVSDE